MPGDADLRQLNLSIIALPTDAITLGTIRRMQPNVFSVTIGKDRRIADCDALSTQYFEIKLAEKAFARASGRADPHPSDLASRESIADVLEEAYLQYGLASGPASARELIRAIERDAAAQAKGQGRPPR